jgi:hypothetical protein
MFRFLFRLVLVVIAFRFIGAFVRLLGGGPPKAARVPPVASPKPLVDKASAIDVPFTEVMEHQER